MHPTESLLKNLESYSHDDYYPFHMPGHKRKIFPFPNPWSVDITEIDGFDDLHHAKGILLALQEKAAALFGSQKSFCLVNGSTCGILASVSACAKPGKKILIARNCHKSAYHGVYLRGLIPVYLMPEVCEFGIFSQINPKTVETALQKQKDIEAILIVSPTYDGIASDIRSIARIAHHYQIPLIVDEAHGAHFPFSSQFPESALSCGADLVIQSLHKTLPSFTQTAILHLNSDLVSEEAIQRFLRIYQSSSPSYLLMASIDYCLDVIKSHGTALFQNLQENLDYFYENCRSLKHLQVLFDIPGKDKSKILISAERAGLSGQKLFDLLREDYHLQLEMASGHYALALSSLMDTREGFLRLFSALSDIDRRLEKNLISDIGRPLETDSPLKTSNPSLHTKTKDADMNNDRISYHIPNQKMTISQALEAEGKQIPLTASCGFISREYLYLYPPGIPLLTPGEEIDRQLLSTLQKLKRMGRKPEGLSDQTNQMINVVNFDKL